MSRLPTAILFDADGTLYESERLNHQAHVIAARDMHDFDFTWELYDMHIRQGSKAGHEVLAQQEIKGFDPDDYQAYKLDIYERFMLDKLQTLPGLKDFLKWCHDRAIKCLVVSASGLNYVENALAVLDLRDDFEAIVSSKDIGDKRKPHPQPYLMGLELAGVTANQAVAVEDTNKGITSAKSAGLRCVAIRNDANTSAELTKADYVISHYDELKAYFLR